MKFNRIFLIYFEEETLCVLSEIILTCMDDTRQKKDGNKEGKKLTLTQRFVVN